MCPTFTPHYKLEIPVPHAKYLSPFHYLPEQYHVMASNSHKVKRNTEIKQTLPNQYQSPTYASEFSTSSYTSSIVIIICQLQCHNTATQFFLSSHHPSSLSSVYPTPFFHFPPPSTSCYLYGPVLIHSLHLAKPF